MGMDTFRKIMPLRYASATAPPYQNVGHAHNFLLQVGLDLGVPGLVAYLSILIVAGVLLVLVGSLYLGPLYQSRFLPLAEDPVANLRALLLPALSVALPLAAMTIVLLALAGLPGWAAPTIIAGVAG